MAGKQQDMVQSAIQQAKELEYEQAMIRVDIDANRKFLRLFAQTGNLTDAQAKWLSDFYPLKGRGTSRTEDQVKATKAVKAAAREEVATARGEEVPADSDTE